MPKQLPRLDGRNILISALSSEDQNLIKPYLEDIPLLQGMIIETIGKPVEKVIFPISGVVSIVVASRHKSKFIEAGIFGCEGMSGASVLLNALVSSSKLNIQVPGNGLQIDADILKRLLSQSHTMHQTFLRFIQVLLTQTAQTAFINKHGNLEERLARWLLMCHDRAPADQINLTHHYISLMLSVRRPGVTVATQILEGKGLIRAKRGEIHIIDREGLEKEAGGYYGIPEKEFQSLFINKKNKPI